MASDFLKQKAQEQAKKITDEFGSGVYNSTAWLEGNGKTAKEPTVGANSSNSWKEAELTRDDGTSLGFISDKGIKAISEGKTSQYTPVNAEEQKTINSYIEYATKKRQELLDNYKATAEKELADIEKEQSKIADESSKLRQSKAVANRTGTQGTEWEVKDTRTAKEKREGKSIQQSSGAKKLSALESKYSNLDEEAEALVDTISDINKYANIVYNNTGIIGQAQANYGKGRLSQDTAQAYSDYISSPSETNKLRADALSALSEQFISNNQNALTYDDETIGEFETALRDWVAVSFAGYLPQLIDQTKASVKGAAIGAATGAVAGSVAPGIGTTVGLVKGAKYGWTLGASMQMFETTQGMVYKTLIDAGYDEEVALKAAKDEAFVSSVIEGAGELFSMSTLGVGKLAGKIAPNITGKVSNNIIIKGVQEFAEKTGKKISQNVFSKVATNTARVFVNAIGEYAEEYSQEAVSVANERRLQNSTTGGKFNLVGETISLLRNMDDATATRLETAGKEGFRIGLMMGGTATAGMSAVENFSYANQGKQIKNADVVKSVINVGLNQSKDSYAYKLAEKAQDKLHKNGDVSNSLIGQLVNENKGGVINVGDTYYDTKNQSTLRVISRDENNTIIESISPDGSTVTKSFLNEDVNSLVNENRFVLIDRTVETTTNETQTVAEPTTAEETTEVETPVANENTVSVGDAFIDSKTNNILKVVGRDDTTTTIELTTPDGKKEVITRPNHGADTLAVDEKYRKVETSIGNGTAPATTEGESLLDTDENLRSVYNALISEKLSTSAVNKIVNTPVLKKAFEQLTGVKIEGTKAEQRAIVRNFHNNAQNIADLKAKYDNDTKNNVVLSEGLNTADETTSAAKETITEEEISVVVDAMKDTLKEGAEEGIYAGMPANLEKSLDTFAKQLIKAYKRLGTIGRIAECFSDGGKKVISAIESVLTKSNLTNGLDNNLDSETAQKTGEVLQNQSEGDTIEEKTTAKTVPDADKSRTVAYTNDNEKVDLVFRVVSVDDLVVSNSLDGKVNPDYPQTLQPRDRSRTSSQSQIRQIAANLNPARLAESTSVSEGSPIVGFDNVVESGNGRTLAIKLAYENGTADEYRNYIISNADKYGLDVSNLPEKPVLVRERITTVDRREFTRKANESSIGSLSATEQAKVDAEKLTEDVLNLLVANDDGVINTSDNHDFISAVISKVFKNEDLNNVVNAEGRLSARGLERITNAIFYKAYGDVSLSARLSESLDNDMKNATKVLLNIAPRIVSIKNGISSGSMYDFDFSTDIVNAIKLFEKCRNENTTLENHAAQESLFEKEPMLVMAMAYVFETKNRGAKQATDFYNLLLDTVEELGNPKQISLDIIETFQTKEEIFNATVEKFNNRVEPKNAIAIPENILESESEQGREDDRRGIDEVSGNRLNKNEKTKNAVGVQPDNRRSEETRVVADDEQLRQKSESDARQSEVEREDNGNERRSNSLSENSRRGNNGGTRKQTGRFSYFERKNKGKNATERKSFARELIQRGHTEEVIEKIGKHTYKYTLVKPEYYNDDMLSMIEEAKKKGVELGFFIGNAKVNFDSKDAFLIDGIKISGSKVLVQYDEHISPQKLFKHELGHAKWKTVEGQRIKDTILNSLSEADRQNILSQDRYKRYMEMYKKDKNREDIVLEEFVCDVMSGMNNYTAKYADVVADYWYGNEAIDSYSVAEYTESIDAGGENTERYSLNWRTDLNQTQYKEVVKWLRQEGNAEEKSITDTARWYKGRIDGEDLFVIYSTEDSAPTILYEIKGEGAKAELNILQKILEVIENGKSNIGIQRNIDRLLSGDWVQEKHNLANNNDRLGERGSDIGYASVLQGESPQFIGSPAFRNVIKNLLDIQNESVRFSLADSEGNTLTEGQQEYFKDSMVRDDNGNLLVMYQGSANDFTVFDRKKSSYANLYGRGFYFTKSENHASQYGKTRAYYLNIKHPVSTTETTITKSQLRKFLQAVAENEDYSFENYGYGATVDSVLQSTYGKSDFLMLNDVSQTAIGDLVEAAELFNEVNETDYDGIMLDTETVIFNSEQAKLTSNENPTSDPDVRFSLAEPVEETKNLVAVHNMQVSELERTLDLGGLPMPSIAIIKAQSGHSEYGDVSLVFDKQTIDPKASKSNKVYGGDAWTPTYPTIEYKPNAKVADKISKKYYELGRKFGYDESRPLYNYVYELEEKLNRHKGETEMINELYDDTEMMQLYLLDSGKNKVETITKETRTELTEAEVEMNEFFINELGADVVDEVKFDGNGTPIAYRKNYMSKYEDAIRNAYKKLLSEVWQFSDEQVQKVLDAVRPVDYLNFVRNAYKYRQDGRVTIKTEDDREATKKAIRDAAGEDYRKWVDSLFKGIEEKSGIRNNADYFTNSGNRRSWEALHWENNLENVVKVMKSQNDVGSAAIFTGHGIWGVAAKNYRSIEEIKADADRLKKLPEEEYNKIKESFGERLHEIAYSIMSKSERNPFIAEDNAMECIIDAVRNSKTKSGILKNLKEYQQLTVTETTVDDIISLVNDISNMPTEYFEAKPQRAVELNEIATAIIPDSTSETTKSRLDDMGIKYLEYESGNEDARLEALNSLEDVRFSLADNSYAPTFYSQMGKTIDEMKQDKIGANSVIPYLKGRGVKDEEIKWSGIESFLDGKKSVTKAELQEFVANSQLQIEETVLEGDTAVTVEPQEADGTTVWTMPITDSMKESVLYEGQVRYSLATDGILDLEDLWTDAIETYGTIPKGEIPARDVDVPKKISKKDVVSRFARTMIEAGVTPDETVSEFEKAILDGTMTHEVITDKRAREKAVQLIKHLGFEDALERWSVLSDASKVGKNELALGMELYNQCITNKDVHNAMKIAAELVTEATRAGQTLQAARMLKRMTPDGQLYYLEKSIQKMNEEFKEKLGDKYKDIELDESLMEEFLTQEDETKRNEAYDKICQNIADQIPATMLDKWNSWRYLAMLGNPRTHLRNIFGNAVFVPSLKLKNYIGAVLEKVARVNTADRTKSLLKNKEAVRFAKSDVEEMIKVLQGENAKYAVTSDIQSKRTIFKTRFLEKLRLKNFDFLEREDMWFLKHHYTDALARLVTARKIDVDSITPEMLEKVRAYAVKEAQAATYRDANALAEGLNRLQRNLEHSNKRIIRATGILVEGVMPFKKTPMNIAKQGLNYSPLGILNGVYKAFTKLRKGDSTVTEVIDDLSKGLSGTMVMMLGYFLASMGYLGGDEDKSEKEKEFDKMVGEQSYSLNIGDDYSYTIDWMTPSNLALFIGAKLYDFTKDDFQIADVFDALSTVTEPLLELSVFSGLNGVIESAQYSDSEALITIGSEMITSYLMQGLPTLGGQISRMVDESKREYYYADKNSDVPQGLQRLIGQASSKIPFASYLFQPAIDEWGREETYGSVAERILENTVSPGYYAEKNYTTVDKKLKELYDKTGDNAVFPVIQQKKYTEDGVDYHMSAKDYTEAKKLRGQKSFELVSELFADGMSVKLKNKETNKYEQKRYSQMSDDEKVRAIKKCYEEAGDYAKAEMLEKVKSKSKSK